MPIRIGTTEFGNIYRSMTGEKICGINVGKIIYHHYRDPILLLMATRNPVNSPVEGQVVEILLFTRF